MQECRVTPPSDGAQDSAQYDEPLCPGGESASASALTLRDTGNGVSDSNATIGGFAIGAAWGLFAISIWAGWFIVTRFGADSSLTSYDLVALRYSVTLVVLLPFLIRIRSRIALLKPADAFMMALGSGAAFSLCITAGVAFAPAAEGAALTPGVMPVMTALVSVVLLGEVLRRRQMMGLVFTLCGVVAIAGAGLMGTGHLKWVGHLLFMSAAFLFALYTVALRRSRLSGLEATAFVSLVSCAVYLPVYFLTLHPRLLSASPSSLALQAFYQGIAVNIISLVAFGRAVARLGAARASAFAAAVPALTLILAMLFLGEIPSMADGFGIVAVTIGVLLASGAPLPSWLRASKKEL